ncbi:MAG: isopentenyl phosphate kinase family protein [Candidatus Levybacteria bacterium]|nr:isopentenyl phosphate kinase family protein [Candidatus Levybacteria bacterium]
MRKVILIKFGGSIITDKNVPYKARPDVIRRLAKELKKIKDASIILAHGSGSFGHTSAKEFGGKKGYKSNWGIAKVARDAMEINRIVMDILVDEGLPTVSLRPMSMMTTNAGKLEENFFKPIVEVLNRDLLPVVYGDVIWDREWKSTILSGEVILNEIGKYLMKKGFKVGKIIQVGETNGVYDDNGNTIPFITNTNWENIKHYIFRKNKIDVTGGMRHKIENALLIANEGVETWIANGIIPNELSHALNGKDIRGTIIQ